MVEPNKPYGITLTFKEGRQWQFANHSTLAYDMPAGMYIPDDQTKQLEIVVTSGGITYEADATLNITTDGKLTIKFDESDPEFPRLANANNVSLRAQFNACFDGSETTIRFSDTRMPSRRRTEHLMKLPELIIIQLRSKLQEIPKT